MNKMTRAIIEILDDVDCVITPDGEAWFSADGEDYINPDFRLSLPLAKLLQARMRQDGWKITVTDCDSGFYANAYRENKSGCSEHFIAPSIGYSKTEPAALFDLFCKVYGITYEN